MSQQSSVEWVVEQINQIIDFIPMNKWDEIRDVVQQAKAMHKDEIMDAFQEGKWDGWQNHKLKTNGKESQWTDPAHYYNETFNTKEK